MFLSKHRRWCVTVVYLLSQLVATLAEEENNQDDELEWMDEDVGGGEDTTDDAVVSTTVEGGEGEEIIAAFCILLAVGVSLIGVCMAYFAVQEDALMRIYMQRGLDLRATVLEANISKDAIATQQPKDQAKKQPKPDKQDKEKWKHSRREYNVLIEYKLPNEKFTVTKRVKTVEMDLKEGPTIPRAIKLDDNDVRSGAASPPPLTNKTENALSIADVWQGLDVFVLAQYPKSAIPQGQAIRACSIQYRLPTILSILFLFAMSFGFAWLGLATLTSKLPFGLGVAPASAILWVILFFVQVFGVHYTLGGLFRAALKEMYLDSGECLAPSSWDETTISTNLEDSYLKV